MMADRASVPGTEVGYNQWICIKFLDDSNCLTMCNAKQPVCGEDILTLPESGQQARRWIQQASVVSRGVESFIQCSMQVHVFDAVNVPCTCNASHICTSWDGSLGIH